MSKVEYGKNTTIDGLLFEYVLEGGRHSWVHRQGKRGLYYFFEKSDGRYALFRSTERIEWVCTDLNVLRRHISSWEREAGQAGTFRTSEAAVLS